MKNVTPIRSTILSLSQRLGWMEEIFSRVRGARKIRAALAGIREPSWRRDFASATLRATLLEGVCSPLFEIGVPECSSDLAETFRRLRTSLVAPGFEPRDLREWFLSAIAAQDPTWMREVSVETVSEIIALIQDGDALSGEELLWLRRAMVDAMLSLAMDLHSVHKIGANVMFLSLDFQLISRRVTAHDERLQAAASALREEIAQARTEIEEATKRLSPFQLEKCAAILDRVELLVDVLTVKDQSQLAQRIQKLVVTLAEGAVSERDFKGALRHYTSHVSHELAERMGTIGESYIVRSTQDYVVTLLRAGGGGLITAGTIIAKFVVGSLGLGVFVAGAMTSLNYMVSFLIMQLLGFRLATKQPSLTAPALINRLKATRMHSQTSLRDASNEVASIAQSQFAAALGNFAFVIPATLIFHWVYRWVHSRSFLTDQTAFHVLDSMHPFRTLTIPYAILTGVLLWLATVLAGSVERWASERGSLKAYSKTVFGIGSCIFLGALLALVPLLGTAFGLPIDVRHFTLSTGSLAMAVCTLGFSQALAHGFAASFVGVLMIGVLNFSVSFALSLTWSAVARGVRRAHLTQVFGLALKNRIFPSHFIFPMSPITVPEIEHDAL